MFYYKIMFIKCRCGDKMEKRARLHKVLTFIQGILLWEYTYADGGEWSVVTKAFC